MKRLVIAVVMLAAVGCKTRNPFDTTALESELAWHEDRTLYLQQQMVYAGSDRPPEESLTELAPNLDTWRATDVHNADAATLLVMEQVSVARIARLEAAVAAAAKQPERVVHAEWLAAFNDLNVERRKHALIQAEIHIRVGSARY
jgi:hypothetical protein